MKQLLVFHLILLSLNSIPVKAQVTLLLERPGTIKYYMYHKGDHLSISYRKGTEGFHDAGEITDITDSTFQINNINRYNFRDVACVYRPRFLPLLLARTALVFGVGYTGLTAANQAINSKRPLIDGNTLAIGGSALAVAGISSFFEKRKFELDEKWRLRKVDLGFGQAEKE